MKRAKILLKMEVPVVIIGDFNIIPTDWDVYKPEKFSENALFRIEVRKAFKQLIGQGWTDSIRLLFKEDGVYTFWEYFRNAYGRNAGLRLDHILLSPKIVPRLLEGGIDRHVRGWEKSSDHAPVWIMLGDKNEYGRN